MDRSRAGIKMLASSRMIPLAVTTLALAVVALVTAGCAGAPTPTASGAAASAATSSPTVPSPAPSTPPTTGSIAGSTYTPGAAPTAVPGSTPSASAGAYPAGRPLRVEEIAATAVAEAQGEQCLASGPPPAKGFIGNPARGKVLFSQRGCSACHGQEAQGNIGPKIAGTTLPFSAVIKQLREPRGVMTRYLPSDQSDADECDVYIYLQTLK